LENPIREDDGMAERIEDIAQAMVAKGKGILAADESNAIHQAKRFETINTPSTSEDARRDYREMLFSASDGDVDRISPASSSIDETIRQKAKDGTPLVDLIKADRRGPRASSSMPAPRPLALSPKRDGHRGPRRPPRAPQGVLRPRAHSFAKWRAVIDVGPMPADLELRSTPTPRPSPATPPSARKAGLVPIVEPEVLMDGPVANHDIDTCIRRHRVDAERRSIQRALRRPRRPRGHSSSSRTWSIPGKKIAPSRPRRAEVAALTAKVLKGMRARPPSPGIAFLSGGQSGRGGHRAPPAYMNADRRPALAAHLLLRPRAPGRRARGVGRQAGECDGRPAGVQPPRRDEQPCRHRVVAGRAREKGRLTSRKCPNSLYVRDVEGSGRQSPPPPFAHGAVADREVGRG
jgi:fructose-bisphosphate aldolase class I